MNSGSPGLRGQSFTVKNSNPPTDPSPLYEEARIFRNESSYKFDMEATGTCVVRLHFFPFSSPENLSTAIFDVSASGLVLLRNFTAPITGNSPIIEEFFISISVGKLIMDFRPHESSFAFINAIEVYIAPKLFFPDELEHVQSTGKKGKYTGIMSNVLHKIHRINVGGSPLTPDNDTLWRYWVPDDIYLSNPSAAKNSTVYTEKPKYQGDASEYIAPDFVYQTAKEMNIDTNRTSNIFNVSWSFNVSKNSTYFVRSHFCDTLSLSQNSLSFYMYLYSRFSQEIDPFNMTRSWAAPFFYDHVVDSDGSGLLNISIGPNAGSANAFLNGLEIMEIVKLGSVSVGNEHKKMNVVIVLVVSVVGVLTLVCILAFLLFLGSKCRKPKTIETSDWQPPPAYGGGSSHDRLSQGTPLCSPVANLNLGLKISFSEIQFATNNFDKNLQIGKGGFGIVFKGTLKNGMKVAVKRSEPGSSQGLPEFQTEILVLSKLRHRHLVSLIGYCKEGFEMILVYEFMERGSLRDHLYKTNLPPLSWMQRLEICIGAARGLHYLHRGSAGGFIHRDVKSTNILLDINHVAKVADFGLSRLECPDETNFSTDVKGTFGYLDPEYFTTLQLTEKSDVYSFGVVLLEVLCARPAINQVLPIEEVNLAEWGILCKKNGMLEQIVDPYIKSQIKPNSLRKFAETAEKCLQDYGADRPAMGDVLWDLEYALQLQKTARHREPHEDSVTVTNASAAVAMSHVPDFSSTSFANEKDSIPILENNSSSRSTSEVFSSLRIDNSR
ncbi:receptor-like protein kinase [Tripterygium wilfordii]|uniref:Receptor-like protein kinase n=2 Tax=Tripterygium wilfordii TaxID=458696 RepID=A0A7J7CVY9_TRIWF|nr:receptor-like protein kinase [Tripterygium wilfordii]